MSSQVETQASSSARFFEGAGRIVKVLSCALFVGTLISGWIFSDLPNSLLWANAGALLALISIYTFQQKLLVYVLKRIGEALVVLWVIATLTFVLLRTIPGGPFDSEKALAPEVRANIEAKYKLNEPLLSQYTSYLSGVVQGDFGESYKYVGRPISDIVIESLPASFELGLYALILSFLIGIPAGVYAAAKHNSWVDNAIMVFAISGVSLPSFLVAPILIIVFCFWWNLLPPAFWEGPEYYILPVVVLGVRPAAAIARLVRASVLDVIHSDYIRTARSKGLSQNKVLFKHVLKNSLIPVISYSGPLAAGILTGSFVIEVIFAIPGMAKHFVMSVSNRDYPLILGLTLVFSALLVLCNLLADLMYSYADPRIRLGS